MPRCSTSCALIWRCNCAWPTWGTSATKTAYGFNQLGRAAYLTLKWAMR